MILWCWLSHRLYREGYDPTTGCGFWYCSTCRRTWYDATLPQVIQGFIHWMGRRREQKRRDKLTRRDERI